jgi:hypothetical protein
MNKKSNNKKISGLCYNILVYHKNSLNKGFLVNVGN